MLYVEVNELGQAVDVPLTYKQLRLKFPHISFKSNPTNEDLLPLGFVQLPPEEVIPEPLPGHKLVLSVPVMENGRLKRTWIQQEMSEEDKQLRMRQLREKRNKLLQESDASQLSDVQARMTSMERKAWADYREALRNLPQQALNENKFFRHQFPAKPSPKIVPPLPDNAAIGSIPGSGT